MQFLGRTQRALLGAAVVAALCGVLYFAGRKVDVASSAAAVTPDVQPAPLARLVIRNDGNELIRGRVRSGPTTFAFVVPEGEVRELQLAAGPARIEVDADPPIVRDVVLDQGEIEEVGFGGLR